MTLAKVSFASLFALAVVASPLAPPPASAEQQQGTDAVQAPESGQFDDAKLRSFVTAFLAVNQVAQTYQPQYDAATDEEEQQRIQVEAAEGMTQAVEDTQGISVEEYNSIIASAQTDPQLAEQLVAMIREAGQPQQSETQQGEAPQGETQENPPG